jgi:uncharacterized MAPEG superfamily protein
MSELAILGWYGLFTLLTIAAQIYVTRQQVGFQMMISNRDNMPKLQGLAGRLDRAQANNVVALALFAPAVLLNAQTGGSTAALAACVTFLVMRVLYVFAYAAGIGLMRMAVWLASYLSVAFLYALAVM